MENIPGVRLSSRFVGRMRVRYIIISIVLLVALLCATAYSLLKHPTLLNFAHGTAADVAGLKAAWAKGEIIVFVRHAERCDQSDASCLSAKDGITVRGSDEARGVGKEYQRLGLQSTDIFSSPLTRTTQTATFMFEHAVATQEWLANCRMTLLANAIKQKVVGRNLILVTHSDCIREIERDLKIKLPHKPAYTSSLFISLDEKNTAPHALGFIEAAPFSADF
jgi:phosphohistidine phosphatase SixA